MIDVLKWTCPQPDCKKLIISIYPKQFEQFKKQHENSHNKKMEG